MSSCVTAYSCVEAEIVQLQLSSAIHIDFESFVNLDSLSV